jgi:hypothetical protein
MSHANHPSVFAVFIHRRKQRKPLMRFTSDKLFRRSPPLLSKPGFSLLYGRTHLRRFHKITTDFPDPLPTAEAIGQSSKVSKACCKERLIGCMLVLSQFNGQKPHSRAALKVGNVFDSQTYHRSV